MKPTLQNKDRLILEKVSYRFSDPERFDIVVFRPDPNQKSLYYIKRIIGLPGETVRIQDHRIFINGKILAEDYGKEKILLSGIAEQTQILSEEEYFVLGDNRNNSKDSRQQEVGFVKRKAITGRAFLRLWPIRNFGVIRHQ